MEFAPLDTFCDPGRTGFSLSPVLNQHNKPDRLKPVLLARSDERVL